MADPIQQTETVLLFRHESSRSAENELFARGAVPERVGSYEVRGVIGRGGMGVVLRVEDPLLQVERALKIFNPELFASERAVARFRNEARLASALAGRGVVAVHEAGTASGLPYYVMDLVEGRTLAEHLAGGPLPADRVAAIGVELCRTLAHAHGMGIVHRDIKPENIILEGDERPLLIDFGLALSYDVTRYTRTGVGIGTPAYMAPEHLEGRSDARSDIYSLGATLYHAACGVPPVTGSIAEMIDNAVSGRIRPASLVNSGVPISLDRVLSAALARQPDQRYPDATSFAIALEDWRRGSDRESGPRRAAWLVAAGLGAAGLALALLALWPTRPSGAGAAPDRSAGPASLGKLQIVAPSHLDGVESERVPVVVRAPRGVVSVRVDGRNMAPASATRGGEGNLWKGTTWAFGRATITVSARRAGGRAEATSIAVDGPPPPGFRRRHFIEGSGTGLAAAFTPEGVLIAAGGGGRVISLSPISGRMLRADEVHRTAVLTVAASADGRWILTGDRDGNLVQREARSGRTVWLRRLAGSAWSVAFSADSGAVACAARRVLEVLDAKSGKTRLRIASTNAAVVAFSPRGGRLAWSEGARIRVHAWPGGREALAFEPGATLVYALAFAPDGDRLASGDASGVVRVLDLSSGRVAATLSGGASKVTSVAFFPDGSRLAASNDDGSVRVFECGSWRCVLNLTPMEGLGVKGVAVSPDGRYLAAGVICRHVEAREAMFVYARTVTPLLHPLRSDEWRTWYALPSTGEPNRIVEATPGVRARLDGNWPGVRLVVEPRPGRQGIVPYSVKVRTGKVVYRAVGALVAATWRVKIYDFPPALHPVADPGHWERILARRPDVVRMQRSVHHDWGWGPPDPRLPHKDYFAVVAESNVRFPTGRYEIVAVSDDGVRVLLDGRRVIDGWSVRGRTFERAVFATPGRTVAVRVEYFDITGPAYLSVRIHKLD